MLFGDDKELSSSWVYVHQGKCIVEEEKNIIEKQDNPGLMCFYNITIDSNLDDPLSDFDNGILTLFNYRV